MTNCARNGCGAAWRAQVHAAIGNAGFGREQAWSHAKAMLRRAGKRTVNGTIGELIARPNERGASRTMAYPAPGTKCMSSRQLAINTRPLTRKP